jgi:hypothetical protein
MVHIINFLLLLVFFLPSCSHQRPVWPAYSDTYINFTYEEINEIKNHLKDLNTKSKKYHGFKDLILLDKIENGYEIIIKYKNQNQNEIPKVAGTALRKSRQCIITIYPVAYERNIIKSVLWHEIGHCANLNHFNGKDDIMYKSVKSFTEYDEYTVERFIKRLNNKIWKRP